MSMLTSDVGVKGRFDLVAFSAVVVTIIFWASSFVVIRICLGPLTPIELATARYVTAGVIALGYLAFRWSVPTRGDLLRISIAAILFIATYAVLLNTGEQTVPARQALEHSVQPGPPAIATDGLIDRCIPHAILRLDVRPQNGGAARPVGDERF